MPSSTNTKMNKDIKIAFLSIMSIVEILILFGSVSIQLASAANRVSEEAKPLAELISRDAHVGHPVNDEATTIGPAVEGIARQPH
jgi:hypothetical protein